MRVKTLSLISFSEALDKVKRDETNYMIRAKWLNKNADFIHGIIILNGLEHIELEKIGCSREKEQLTHWIPNDNGMRGKDIELRTNDVLADDWLGLKGWAIVNSAKDASKLIEQLEKDKTQQTEQQTNFDVAMQDLINSRIYDVTDLDKDTPAFLVVYKDKIIDDSKLLYDLVEMEKGFQYKGENWEKARESILEKFKKQNLIDIECATIEIVTIMHNGKARK